MTPCGAPSGCRRRLDLEGGRSLEFELFLPEGFDARAPTPFLLSMSGANQTHVNGFTRRLPSNRWAVAIPFRPPDAPYFFDGQGQPGDGPWYVRELCRHLLRQFAVEGGRFLFVGVSNGGTSALRCAARWPELCRGLVVVTGCLTDREKNYEQQLRRLDGLAVDMYVGTQDGCGFYEPMVKMEQDLRRLGNAPAPVLTVFQDAGHMVSPLIDEHLLHMKLALILVHSGWHGEKFRIPAPPPGPAAEDTARRLRGFCETLGLRFPAAGFALSTPAAAAAAQGMPRDRVGEPIAPTPKESTTWVLSPTEQRAAGAAAQSAPPAAWRRPRASPRA